MDDSLNIGLSKLNEFQKSVLKECVAKGPGGLSLALGSGKTITSIVLGLQLTKNINPILVIVSKTLVESWVHEIDKFFKDDLKYVIMHNTYNTVDAFVLEPDIKLVITTPEVVGKIYKSNNINDKFIRKDIINEGNFNQHTINVYEKPSNPFSTNTSGGMLIYAMKWGCLIVDEIQKYTKITTQRCQGIAAICASHRWVLSGTMFSEPSTERMLGYHLIIDHPTFPRTMPETEFFIKSSEFKGFNSTIIHRSKNPAFIEPKINQVIVSHKLSDEEEKIYMSMKNTMKIINTKVKEFADLRDLENKRKFSSYLLAMISYLRQCIVCSILPIATVAIAMTDFQNKSKLAKILVDEVNKLGLEDWLNKTESIKSSRFKSALEIIGKHPSENLIIFTCFRTCLDIFKTFLPVDRQIMTIASEMSTKKRAKILEDYNIPSKTGKGHILLLTYELGCEGLNLQVSNTVLLLDFYWNDAQTQQAIARVLRYGQKADVVNIYMFTSNTAIEGSVFEKHDLKLIILEELSKGAAKTQLKKMKIVDIIKIIETEDNLNALKKIHKR